MLWLTHDISIMSEHACFSSEGDFLRTETEENISKAIGILSSPFQDVAFIDLESAFDCREAGITLHEFLY